MGASPGSWLPMSAPSARISMWSVEDEVGARLGWRPAVVSSGARPVTTMERRPHDSIVWRTSVQDLPALRADVRETVDALGA
ncbi:MAG: hypothetical protein ACYDH5_16975 [Acidimicrobiales bacterium]